MAAERTMVANRETGVDFQLHQAVQQTRRLVADREGPAWERLREALDEVSTALKIESGDAAFDRTADRLDRTRLHDSPRDHVAGAAGAGSLETPIETIAALYALYDDPNDERAERAADALVRLRESLH